MSEVGEKNYVLLKKLEIPFSEYVEISKKRREQPYRQGKCRIPKKYMNEEDFGYNAKGFLYRKIDGLVLVKNNKTAGKPRYKKVNGQDIYNGNVSRQSRATLVKALHNSVRKYVKEIEPLQNIENYPLGLYLTFYVRDIGKHNIDNDNKWIWEKVIQDTIVEEGIIPDDNPYIVWENVKRTVLVSAEQEEKLKIEIYGYYREEKDSV